MKICHITTVHKLDDVRIYLKECKSLSKYYNVILVGNDNRNDFSDDKIKIINLKVIFKNRIHRILSTKKLIVNKALKLNADVYHFHDPELMSAALAIKKAGKKVIFDFHEDTPKQILAKHYIPKPIRKPISIYYKKYEEKSAIKFDGIVTATPYLKSKFIKFNKNTVDVNNYPLLNEFKDYNSDFKTRKKQITYVGGLTFERGIIEMIKIANDMQDFQFVFCGDFSSEEEKKSAMKQIKGNNIDFLGYVSREKIIEVLNNSVLGLVLLEKNKRYMDSLPIKMFEYMAAGLPVIASDFPLWNEILIDSKSGICVNQKDVSNIIEKIKQLTEDKETLEQMSESGRKYVLDKYNWENEEVKLLNLYKKLEEN